jgi:hypothetical protein
MAEREYQRLTWARRRPTGFVVFSAVRSSLWLGKDHVLGIDTTGYTESYKRFYFRDIQAITIQKTDRGRMFGLLFGVLGGFSVLFGAVAVNARSVVVAWILGILAAIFILSFFINLAFGPTSACQLRTAVQTEELPSLNRLRRARRVWNRLRPYIVQAQGQVGPEEISVRMRQGAALADAAAPGYVVDDPGLPPRIVP